jgi:hypothetical protein
VAVAISTYKSTPKALWDAAKRTYSVNGERVTQSEVRGYVDKAVSSARAKARAIAEAFLEHRNSAELITSLKDLIRNENLAMSMIANGGREQMTQSLWAKTGNVIKSQYAYADNLGRQIDNGDLTNFGEGFLSRVSSYANQGSVTFNGFFRDGMASIGMMAVNQLGDSAQSCPECLDLAAAGPMSADDMPPEGTRECGAGDNCTVVYLTAEEAADWSSE